MKMRGTHIAKSLVSLSLHWAWASNNEFLYSSLNQHRNPQSAPDLLTTPRSSSHNPTLNNKSTKRCLCKLLLASGSRISYELVQLYRPQSSRSADAVLQRFLLHHLTRCHRQRRWRPGEKKVKSMQRLFHLLIKSSLGFQVGGRSCLFKVLTLWVSADDRSTSRLEFSRDWNQYSFL